MWVGGISLEHSPCLISACFRSSSVFRGAPRSLLVVRSRGVDLVGHNGTTFEIGSDDIMPIRDKYDQFRRISVTLSFKTPSCCNILCTVLAYPPKSWRKYEARMMQGESLIGF